MYYKNFHYFDKKVKAAPPSFTIRISKEAGLCYSYSDSLLIYEVARSQMFFLDLYRKSYLDGGITRKSYEDQSFQIIETIKSSDNTENYIYFKNYLLKEVLSIGYAHSLNDSSRNVNSNRNNTYIDRYILATFNFYRTNKKITLDPEIYNILPEDFILRLNELSHVEQFIIYIHTYLKENGIFRAPSSIKRMFESRKKSLEKIGTNFECESYFRNLIGYPQIIINSGFDFSKPARF